MTVGDGLFSVLQIGAVVALVSLVGISVTAGATRKGWTALFFVSAGSAAVALVVLAALLHDLGS